MLYLNDINYSMHYADNLDIKTKAFDFEARLLIGWLATNLKEPASKSNIFVFMLRWHAFPTVSIVA